MAVYVLVLLRSVSVKLLANRLSFQNVRRVRTSNVERERPDRLLSLLTLAPGGGAAVDLAFAGGGIGRVESDPLDCVLEDLGDPWPTVWRPDHGADGNGT